jgi:hypothetical protein
MGKKNGIFYYNSIYLKVLFAYSILITLWVFFVGSAITFSNYHPNLSYPLVSELFEPWRFLRNLGLLFAFPSVILSLVIFIQSMKTKTISYGITNIINWFLIHLFLVFSYAIGYGLLYLVLLSLIRKG